MDSREYFNSVADKWDSMVYHDTDKINKIMSLIDLQKGSRVLDVGTGTGILIPYISSIIGDNGSVTAIDISDRMIDIAKSKYSYSNVNYIVGDVMEAELPLKNYDCIICYSMFPHLSEKGHAVKKFASLLKSEGKLVVCHSQSRESINNLHKEKDNTVKDDILPEIFVLEGYYNEAGLKTVCVVDNDEMYVIIGER